MAIRSKLWPRPPPSVSQLISFSVGGGTLPHKHPSGKCQTLHHVYRVWQFWFNAIMCQNNGWLQPSSGISTSFTLGDIISPWVAIKASRCAGRVDRILAVKNPGVSLRPSYENGGRVVPPSTITVLLQDIPGEKGSLPIRYPDLIRPMY